MVFLKLVVIIRVFLRMRRFYSGLVGVSGYAVRNFIVRVLFGLGVRKGLCKVI